MNNTINLLEDSKNKVNNITDLLVLDILKSKVLGKNGVLSKELSKIKNLSNDQKAVHGKELNKLKKDLEILFVTRKKEIENINLEKNLNESYLDVSLPGRQNGNFGNLHPISLVKKKIQDLFSNMSFEIIDGPEIEDDFYNFTALNQPSDHPARSMHDTFYLEGGEWLLRTHTSPMQIHYMEGNKPPIKIISPGRVFRVDSDSTHSPMFHQVEGLWIDDDITFSDLKGVLREFLRCFFEDENIDIRFRPSYFPFTEPSAEIDMTFNKSWMEIGGCGMVHPNVLNVVNINSNLYQGFAFGMGLDRLTMLKYGVEDLRMFFENDLRFLKQFS